jgi:hypothetical protein
MFVSEYKRYIMSDDDNSAIDDKKNSGSSPPPFQTKGVLSYIVTMLVLSVLVLLHVCIGAVALFGGKVSQSNILPTDPNCYPYVDNVTATATATATTKIPWLPKDKTTYMENLSFEPIFVKNNDNESSSIPVVLSKANDGTGTWKELLAQIMNPLIQHSFSTFTAFFQGIHSTFPESFFIYIGAILLSLFCGIMVLFHWVYAMYLWFMRGTSLCWSVPKRGFLVKIMMSSIFICFSFLGLSIIIPLMGVVSCISMLYVLLTLSRCTANNKEVTLGSFVGRMLHEYKVFLSWTFSVLSVAVAFSQLGSLTGVFCMLTVLLIYFDILPLKIYEPVSSTTNTTYPYNQESFQQRTKNPCPPIIKQPEENKNNKCGFFGNLWNNYIWSIPC